MSARVAHRDRQMSAACVVCHGYEPHWTGANAQALAARHHDSTGHRTWCEMRLFVTYGPSAPDPDQIDIEDAIASASSGGEPDAAPFTDPDAPTVAPVDVSATKGRPVETRMPMQRDARGHKPEVFAT